MVLVPRNSAPANAKRIKILRIDIVFPYLFVLIFRNACIPSLEENGTHHFRLFQTISTISNAAVQFLDRKGAKYDNGGYLENREEKLLFGKTLLPRACLLHQLTNFTCESYSILTTARACKLYFRNKNISGFAT